jgi:hypothetical protein
MSRRLGVIITFLTLILTLLTLAGCGVLTATPSPSGDNFLLLQMSTEMGGPTPCQECAMATLSALLTQEKYYSDAQAAATAEIMRANAQATLNAASSTLSAIQTQDKNSANIVAAQLAATAEIERANAQATLVAAVSTQSAAFTQDAIRQTQMAELATQNAVATLTQQNSNLLADSTQTAVADHIATQTQSAVATTQWYTDQERQREEQRQGPLTFLWLWCPPFFIVAVALVLLGFFWRWMRIRETQQLIEMQPTTVVPILPKPRAIAEHQDQLATPRDNVRNWLEEVKRKLLTDKKDDDDNPGS